MEKHHDFRGFAGKVNSGQFRVGDEISIFPSGLTSRIKQIDRYGTAVEEIKEGENGTLILTDEIDLSRGSSILGTQNKDRLKASKQIRATLCWMQNQPLNFHQKYILQQGVQRVQTKLSPAENEIQEFTLNSIGESNLKLSQEILNTPYKENKKIGRFILIDPQSNNTAAVGFIQ